MRWGLLCLASALLPCAAVAQDGGIEGSLLQAKTGEPLVGALVRLDGVREVTSDAAGLFEFRGVSAGLHVLRIEEPECTPLDLEIDLEPGEVERVRLSLEPRDEVEEIVIRSPRLQAEVSDRVMEMEEVQKIAGTQGDMLKIVQSMPGVARSMGPAGSGAGIVIRGAAPEDSVVLIDGHRVPLLYHFGGLKSILNSDMLKRIDFLPGGFGADFGRATGGVVDAQTQPCTHTTFEGYTELSLLDAGFFAKGPIGDQAGFFVAARRSTIDLWLPPILEDIPGFELTVAPVYYDYQAKVDWSPAPADRLSLFAFGSFDELRLLLQKPPTGDAAFRGNFGMQLHFHRLLLSWVHAPQASPLEFRMSLAGGYDIGNFDAGNFYMRSQLPSMGYRTDATWRALPWLDVRFGLEAGLIYMDLQHELMRPPKEGHWPSEMQTMEVISGTEQTLTYNGALYAALVFKPRPKTLLSAGVRLEGLAFDGHGDLALMPRLSVSHELRPGTLLKAGFGLYYASPTEDELSASFGNPTLQFERATHYTLGVEQGLPLNASFDLTFFYKSLDQLVVPAEDSVYANAGIGKITGLELLVRRELEQGLYGWLAYTLMQSLRRDSPEAAWRLFDFDQTHILTLVAGYRLPTGERNLRVGLSPVFEFGIRFQLVSGNPRTPIVGGIFDADFDGHLPIPGPVNSERLPLYHRLDARIDYTWVFRYWALSVFVDVQNVYSYRSVEGVQYNYDYTERVYFEGLPILPALGVRGSF